MITIQHTETYFKGRMTGAELIKTYGSDNVDELNEAFRQSSEYLHAGNIHKSVCSVGGGLFEITISM